MNVVESASLRDVEDSSELCEVGLGHLSKALPGEELLPQLRRDLLPGARVATFAFPIPGCRPSGSARVDGISLFLYDTAALEPGGAP